LKHLTKLDLYLNQLTGELPSEMKNLASLSLLGLGYNKLNGTIPAWLGSFELLGRIYLNDNLISGSIPSELGHLSKLDLLWLQGNQLTGTVPSEIGSLTNLTSLWLANNELTGIFPSEIDLGLLDDYDFDLTGNNFTVLPTDCPVNLTLWVVAWHVWDHAEGNVYHNKTDARIGYNQVDSDLAKRLYSPEKEIMDEYGFPDDMTDSMWCQVDAWATQAMCGGSPPSQGKYQPTYCFF
jgi:hypothetical protein